MDVIKIKALRYKKNTQKEVISTKLELTYLCNNVYFCFKEEKWGTNFYNVYIKLNDEYAMFIRVMRDYQLAEIKEKNVAYELPKLIEYWTGQIKCTLFLSNLDIETAKLVAPDMVQAMLVSREDYLQKECIESEQYDRDCAERAKSAKEEKEQQKKEVIEKVKQVILKKSGSITAHDLLLMVDSVDFAIPPKVKGWITSKLDYVACNSGVWSYRFIGKKPSLTFPSYLYSLARLVREETNTQGTVASEAELDHLFGIEQADTDHRQADTDHGQADTDHGQADTDHGQADTDHGQADTDHGQADTDHGQADTDHGQADTDHGQADTDHGQADTDHGQADTDHGHTN